jgi:tyrosyl-tRNA synthetase
MDLPLLNKLNRNVSKFVNSDLLFDIVESKQIVRVGVYIKNLKRDINISDLVFLEKIKIFQNLGHKIIVIFDDFDILNEEKEERYLQWNTNMGTR